ncbi:MAG: DUF2190 family protein [Zoogloea oleivorans]|jgi:hypothetical protein|uniref:DUF2190 family protein n=1 Tax=Zoogloea oleivorans TaxID=1552750 RepID=UPI002A369FA4|nr:DUF2190 family protein [Zoogloea oleivorans]MDY0035401.1 DUF2190 family protein [Zoogloea oleivorans]
MGRQYCKMHAATLLALTALDANRFVALDGGYATSAGGAKDALGVSESSAAIGDAFPVITGFSALVTTGEAIAQHAFVKPAADGSGKAITGTATDHCGRAMEAASAAGQLLEIRILPHRHT